MIKLNDLVLVYEDCTLEHLWKAGAVTELYHSNSDNEIRGASVRMNRLGQKIKRPINNFYPLEVIE